MSNNFSFNFLNGLFFYQFLARKVLMNKFIFFSENHVPDIGQLVLTHLTDQKKKLITDSSLFAMLSVFEFLTNNASFVKKCDEVKLDHFTKLNNVKVSSKLVCFKKYEFFLNMHVLWFRGLYRTNENSKSYVKNKVEYLRYNEPVYFQNKKTSAVDTSTSFCRTIKWNDFTFCNFIPIELSSNLLQHTINLQMNFTSKKEKHIVMLLSFLNFYHKLKYNKK